MFNTILNGVIHEQDFSLFLPCLDQFLQHGPQHNLPIEMSTFICTITHHFSKFYISHNGTLMLNIHLEEEKKLITFPFTLIYNSWV